MDLAYALEDQAFRDGLRSFLAREWAAGSDVAEFRRKAVDAGYLYRGIPKRYGGAEQPADILKARIIAEEFGRAKAPVEVRGNGVQMLVPTLLERGAEWQREKFIPGTLSGKLRWAQGFSEPGAGSDLASLRTRG